MISTEIIQVIALIFVFYIKFCLLDPESMLRTKVGCVKLKIWEKPDHGSVYAGYGEKSIRGNRCPPLAEHVMPDQPPQAMAVRAGQEAG